jgi:glycosyltransferase involved in cell wall biosynthesis
MFNHMLKVCLLTCTKNRHIQLERVVRFVLNQTYSNWVHLIYNNSQSELKLDTSLPTDKFILVNNFLNLTTGKPYKTLGEIYNDAITFIPKDVDLVNFMDDDDIYLPNHVEEGVKGYIRSGLKAYKPKKSYFKHGKGIDLMDNVLEPSIFIQASHIKEYGFGDESVAHHHKWLRPLELQSQIISDKDGVPTYICDWSQEIPTYKTSGNPSNPRNFEVYSEYTRDIGDGIITPCLESIANQYCRTN